MDKLSLKKALKSGHLREFIKQAKVPDDNETQSEDFEKLLREAANFKSKTGDD